MSETQNQFDAWNKSWEGKEITLDEKDGWGLIDSIKLERLIKVLPPHGRVLEVGCGSARLSAYLAARGYTVTGIDYSMMALQSAQRNLARAIGESHLDRNKSKGLSPLEIEPHHLVVGDATSLPFANDKFDIVLSTGLLEHFRNPEVVVSEMVRVLVPGGFFYSDVVPRKFSLFRPTSPWKPLQIAGQEVFEGPYRKRHIQSWLDHIDNLTNIEIIAAGILPPQRIVAGPAWVQQLIFGLRDFWKSLEGGIVSGLLGCYYFVTARKRQ